MIALFKKKSAVWSIVVIVFIILVGTFVVTVGRKTNEASANSTKKSVASASENNANKSSQSNNETNNANENNSVNSADTNNTNAAANTAHDTTPAAANANSSTASQSTTSPQQPKPAQLEAEQQEVQHSQPAAPAKPVQQPTATSPQKYVSKNLGFSLTFPASWQGKYTIAEDNNGLAVIFKPTNHPAEGGGMLFTVAKKTPELYEGMLDTISGAKRSFTANGVDFVIGGPTDIGFPPDNPEYSTYKQLSSERSSVINTIQSVN